LAPLVYSARSSLFGREMTYGLDDDNLSEDDGRIVPLRDIVRIRTYGVPGARMFPGGGSVVEPFERCVLTLRHGGHIAFSSRHFLGIGRAVGRWQSYNPFVDRLVSEVGRLNPKARFIAGMPMRLWLVWLLMFIITSCLCLLTVIFLLSLAIMRSSDVDAWLNGFVLLGGSFAGFSFYPVLRSGWPRDYDPLHRASRS
jgi:hypothetical protein